jgi:hypothetical protein
MEKVNIQTAAYRIQRKPRENEVIEILERLYEENPLPEYAKLYKLLVKAPKGKTKNVVDWVYRASAQNIDTRKYLEHSYSDGERLYATDGKRAHIVPTSLPKGFYDANGVSITRDDDFYPDVMRVLDSALPVTYQSFHVDDLEVRREGMDGKKPKEVYVVNHGTHESTYAKAFIDDALNGEKVFKAGSKGEKEPMVMHLHEDRTALIMPIFDQRPYAEKSIQALKQEIANTFE